MYEQTIRISDSVPHCAPDLLRRLKALSTTVVSDSMNRTNAIQGVSPLQAPFSYDAPMVGQAFTVKTAFGDNLVLHQALEFIQPGQVIAVDAGGLTNRAITGEIMVKYAYSQGCEGLVVHGAVRDADSLRSNPMPVFASGITHLGPYKNGPGEIGCPVSMGGVLVEQGDVLMGDCDGVVVVPLRILNEVLVAAEAKEREEQALLQAIDEGTYSAEWLSDRVELEWVSIDVG